MKIKDETAKKTIHSLASLIIGMVVAICQTPFPGSARAEVFEDGAFWMSSVRADPLDIEPAMVSGELEIAGSSWMRTGQVFPGGASLNNVMSIDSISPVGDGYYRIRGTRDVDTEIDVTVAVTPTLVRAVDPAHDGGDLGMTLMIPKADNPVAADFDGHWRHIAFQTGVDETGRPRAEAQAADIELNAALGAGTHQNPGETSDPFTWTVDSALSSARVDLGPVAFDLGVGDGGVMMRCGLEVGQSDAGELSLDLFVKSGMGRQEQEAVGRYAVEVLATNGELSQWNTYRGILAVEDGGSYHVDFDADAMGARPEGWSDDGTWTMDETGCVAFTSQEGEHTLLGQLSLTGDVIVALDTSEAPEDDCSLIVATHVVPEPNVWLLLISTLPMLLFGRRK